MALTAGLTDAARTSTSTTTSSDALAIDLGGAELAAAVRECADAKPPCGGATWPPTGPRGTARFDETVGGCADEIDECSLISEASANRRTLVSKNERRR